MATIEKVELSVGVWWMLQNLAAGLCVPNSQDLLNYVIIFLGRMFPKF